MQHWDKNRKISVTSVLWKWEKIRKIVHLTVTFAQLFLQPPSSNIFWPPDCSIPDFRPDPLTFRWHAMLASCHVSFLLPSSGIHSNVNLASQAIRSYTNPRISVIPTRVWFDSLCMVDTVITLNTQINNRPNNNKQQLTKYTLTHATLSTYSHTQHVHVYLHIQY